MRTRITPLLKWVATVGYLNMTAFIPELHSLQKLVNFYSENIYFSNDEIFLLDIFMFVIYNS